MAETKKTTAKKTSTAKKAAEVKEEAVKVEAPVEEAPKAKKAPAKKAAPKAEKAEAPKKAKEEKKAEAPKKPMPTEAKAIAKNVRVTPRKVRLVIDLVRGLPVKQALGILSNVNRAASEPVMKVIKSAAANADVKEMNADNLYVSEVYAHQGPTMKRWRAGARGSASKILKRSSHVGVTLKERNAE